MTAASRASAFVLHNGRRLAFAEWGKPKGRPVLFVHGVPGSRVWSESLAQARLPVRLITVDRPGYGGSDLNPGATPISWSEDVRELADSLGLDRFAIAAWSQGGVYALACAAAMPGRVTRVGLVSISHVPLDDAPDELASLSDEERDEVAAAWSAPAGLVRRWLDMGKFDFFREPERILERLGAADRWVGEDPALRTMLTEHLREAARGGLEGQLWEEVAVLRPWGFRLADVEVEVHLWRGSEESAARIDLLAQKLPNPRVVVWAGEGHFGLFRRWDEVLDALMAP